MVYRVNVCVSERSPKKLAKSWDLVIGSPIMLIPGRQQSESRSHGEDIRLDTFERTNTKHVAGHLQEIDLGQPSSLDIPPKPPRHPSPMLKNRRHGISQQFELPFFDLVVRLVCHMVPHTRLWISVLFLAIVAFSQFEESASGQNPSNSNTPELPIVEFNAQLLNLVIDRTHCVLDSERDLMIRVLEHAGQIDYVLQRKASQELLEGCRSRMPEFSSRSDTRLFLEEMLRSPERYRGKLVTLHGYVDKVFQKRSEQQITLFQLRLYTEAAETSPVDIFSLRLPDNWPTGISVIDDVSVTGYFFKISEHRDEKTGEATYVPVILARQVDWQPTLAPGKISIDPTLWDGRVKHKSRGVSQTERDLYYCVLKHAGDGNYKQQKAKARSHRLTRIEKYREEATAELDSLKTCMKRFRQKNPGRDAEYLLQVADAKQRYRRKLQRYRQYREKPNLFPAYGDLFFHAESFQAQLVTLRGQLRSIKKFPADKNRYGLTTLYEAWFYTADSQNNPAVVVCTSVPADLMSRAHSQGDRLNEPISMTGYFFKMYGYEAQDANRVAPMFLAQRLEWLPIARQSAPISPRSAFAIFAVLALAAGWFLLRVARIGKRYRVRRAEWDSEPANLNLPTSPRPPDSAEISFEGIEAIEEPDFRSDGPVEAEAHEKPSAEPDV